MKLFRPGITGSVFMLFLCGAATAWAQEQTIDCKNVPAAVRAAFAKAYPKATIKGCAKEVEESKVAYEIASVEGKTGRDVLYRADGELVVVEETIAAGSVPKPVQRALRKRFPKGEIELAEKVMRGEMVVYEFHVKHRGKSKEIAFDASGKEVMP